MEIGEEREVVLAACGFARVQSRKRRAVSGGRSAAGSCLLDLAALGEGHHGEGRPGVRDVVLAIAVGRAREPPAALALIALQPRDPFLDPNIVSRHARPAQHIEDKAGRVTVAGLEVLLLVGPRVVAEGRQRPAAAVFSARVMKPSR